MDPTNSPGNEHTAPDRVLIIEDDAIIRHALADYLRDWGYETTTAADGAEGIALARSGQFHIILADMRMPHMDGLQVVATLKTEQPDLPVVIVSGTGVLTDAIEAMRQGAWDYIAKPIQDMGDIVVVIERVLDKTRLITQRAQAEQSLRESEKALRRRNRDLTLLTRVSQELGVTLDMEQVAERLLQAVVETIGTESASVWMWDDRSGPDIKLVCYAVFRQDRNRSLLGMRLRPGQGVAGWVAQNGKSVILNNARDDPRFSAGADKQTGFHTDSLLTVPLRARYATIGVLSVVNKLEGDFDEGDLTLVETLATSAAIAFDNTHLVQALRNRTAELQASNEELNAFAHTVAHDLKGLVGIITGYAAVMRKRLTSMLSKELQQDLDIVEQTGHKISSVIDELLLFAKMRRLEDVEVHPLDMARIVAEAQKRLTMMIDEHQAEIILPDDWPVALGYGPWIEEVWVNYLSNALKYGGKPPRVELGYNPLDQQPTRHTPDDSNECKQVSAMRFWVRDNGPGLTPKEQKRLFTPFTRLERGRIDGHGLGLSIVRRIIEKLGGKVGVESPVHQLETSSWPQTDEESQGSLFWFCLSTPSSSDTD
ncbi:MAG: response regulator [Chloroflexi bacterium]|nr:response regulator [Chloroflexota bacterium]